LHSLARVALLFSCLALAGCAWTTAVAEIDGSERGFSYPICYPFLVVSGAKSELMMVPNPNRRRAAQFGAFLAKNDIEVTFETCGPSTLKSKMDSTEVVLALFTTLQEAIKQPGAKLFGNPVTAGETGQSFQVFEFVFDNEGNFVDLKPRVSPGDFVRVHTFASSQAGKDLSPPKGGDNKPADPLQ